MILSLIIGIIIINNLSESELVQLYKESEVFVSLSAYEGFGIPVLEAISNQCKVLVSDIPVFHELFTGYVNFTKLDSESVRVGLEEIIKEKKLPISTTSLLEKFSYRKAAISIDEYINSLPSVN